MTVKRLLLAAAVLAGLASAAWWSRQADWAGPANAVEDPGQTTGLKMTAAADKFVGPADAKQKGKAAFAFDGKERTNWYFMPLQEGQEPHA